MGYFGKRRQLRPQWDLTKLIDLAEQMKAKGQDGLRIDKDKLGVEDLSFLEYFSHSLEPYVDSPKNVQVDKILDGRFPEIVNHSSGGYVWIEPRREY